MAFTPAPDTTIRLTLNWSLRGQACVNVLHYAMDPGRADADIDDLADAVAAEVVSDVLPGLGPQITLTSVGVVDVTDVGGYQYVKSVGSAGTAGTACLPNMEAFCITLRSSYSGRSGRGRIYLPGMAAGSVAADPNFFDAGSASAVKGVVQGAILTVPAALPEPATLLVTSYYSGVDALHRPIRRDTAVNFPVTSITHNTRIDTQRRRRPA